MQQISLYFFWICQRAYSVSWEFTTVIVYLVIVDTEMGEEFFTVWTVCKHCEILIEAGGYVVQAIYGLPCKTKSKEIELKKFQYIVLLYPRFHLLWF